MKLYVIWRTALKAIKKNRRRSMLTMLGIIIGISAVITIMAIGRGFEKYTVESLTGDKDAKVVVEVNFEPRDFSLYDSNESFFEDIDITKIKQIDGVADVVPDVIESGIIYVDVATKKGTTTKLIELVGNTDEAIIEGRNITNSDYVSRNKVAVIDNDTALELFGSEENAVGNGIDIEGELFTIVGVYATEELDSLFSMDDANVMISDSSYYYYFKEEDNNHSITATIENGYQPNLVTTDILNFLEEEGSKKDIGIYNIYDTSLLTDGISSILGAITYFISAIAGISLFIAGIGVMNMMYISVAERTSEIGIRRAMGATEKSIRLQFLLEGMTITMIGGGIGYTLGMIFASTISLFLPFPVSIDLFTIMLAISVSTLIGLIFSVIPASVAAKKDLIDILK